MVQAHILPALPQPERGTAGRLGQALVSNVGFPDLHQEDGPWLAGMSY